MKKNYLLLAGIIMLASCTKTFQEPQANGEEISTQQMATQIMSQQHLVNQE
jgi:uncharacterized lipoprotein YajG